MIDHDVMRRPRWLCSLVILALFSLLPGPTVHAEPGDLDPSFAGFGSDGIVVKTEATARAVAMVLQPDGKLVTAGTDGRRLLIARYLPNGTLDPSFYGDGIARFGHPEHAVWASDIAIQADGQFVVAGRILDGRDDFMLARFGPTDGLDPSFGEGGFVATDFDGAQDVGEALVIQSDGKIVAAGWAYVGGDHDMAVARYLPDGSLDPAFSDDGRVTVGFGNSEYAKDIAIQADGKLVVVGSYEAFEVADFAVMRLNVDGSLDGGFGSGGKVRTGFGAYEGANAVVIQPDGKIVVAGDNVDDATVARYTANGTLDGSFDGDGKVSIGSLSGGINDVALRPDGRIVLVGTHESPDGDYKLAVYSLNPDSSLDTTFDADGRIFVEVGAHDEAAAVALLSDGRLVAAGWSGDQQMLVRLWPDGSFDSGGRQALGVDEPGFPPGSIESTYGMAIQADGRIVVAGEVANAERTESDALLARFMQDGTPDTTFGNNGRLLFGLGVFNGARAVAIQTDGKIVTAGYFRSGTTVNFMVARFNADGSVDNTFALFGQNLMDFLGGDDWGWALAIAPDGKIVVAGEAYNGARTVFGVARFNTDGSPDTTFDIDAKQLIEHTAGLVHWATSVVVQPDRKIVMAGQVGSDFALLRLREDGGVDGTFGSGGWTITDMGGADRISALLLPASGMFLAAGTRSLSGSNDFAVAQYSPNGILATCAAPPCGTWPEGKAFVDWGASDTAAALDWRGDGTILVAGCAEGMFAWAQLRSARMTGNPVVTGRGMADFPGSGECAAGARFAGVDRLILAGSQEFGGDRNIALARFETTQDTSMDPPTPSVTPSVTPTETPAPSATPTDTPTATSSSTPTSPVTSTPSTTPTRTPTPKTTLATPSQSPTVGATASPTQTPPLATRTPTGTPTASSNTFVTYLPWAGR